MSDQTNIEEQTKMLRDLEDMLLCGVCLDVPQGPVKLCRRGHHFCQACRARLLKCPVCDASFSGMARGFVVEQLVTTFDTLRAMLIPPPPAVPTTKCCIGVCQLDVPHDRICEHARVEHVACFVELQQDQRVPRSKLIRLKYELKKSCSFGFKSQEGDFFVVTANVEDSGSLIMKIQVAQSSRPDAKFSYKFAVLDKKSWVVRKGKCCASAKEVGNLQIWPRSHFTRYYDDVAAMVITERPKPRVRCLITIDPIK